MDINNEFSNITDIKIAQTKASTINNLFNQHFSFYNKMSENYHFLDFEMWMLFMKEFNQFKIKKSELDNQWQNISKSTDLEILKSHFIKMNKIFLEFEAFFNEKIRNPLVNINESSSEFLMSKFNNIANELQNNLNLKISEIKDELYLSLLEIKTDTRNKIEENRSFITEQKNLFEKKSFELFESLKANNIEAIKLSTEEQKNTVHANVHNYHQEVNRLMSDLKTEVSKELSDGYKNLIDLKKEYNFQDTFANNIKSQKRNTNILKWSFFASFVISIALIPTLLIIIPQKCDFWKEMDELTQWITKGSISVSLIFISIFFFNQYKINLLLNLRFNHLHNFIGGGNAFVSELLRLQDQSKKDFEYKLADMFINMDDIMGAINKNYHPTEGIMKQAADSMSNVANRVNETVKTISGKN